MRELVKIRRGYNYFNQNKLWIISIFYVCAIVKDFIWFSTFGVNILSYVSIQDTFISFLNHTMILVVLTLNYFFFQLIFSNAKNKLFINGIKFAIILGTSTVYFFMFKKPMSFLLLLTFMGFIYYLHMDKKYTEILFLGVVFLIGFSTIEPLTQGLLTKVKNNKEQIMLFKWNESNMDYYSFSYENKLIDTELEKYFLIGNTKDYFFIFDRKIDKTLVINKSNCKNIKAKFKALDI